MGIFSRIFKLFQSETHSVIDKLEDPIRMTEQGIRDLKKDLNGAMKSLAEVKAISIRMSKDGNDAKSLAKDYERKAMALLKRAQSGDLEVSEADRLATEALSRKEEAAKRATEMLTNHKNQQAMADKLQAKVNKLKAQVDASSTIAMLEKMKDKVTEEESLAEAYGELQDAGATVDEEIDAALESGGSASAADSLEALKRKMGMLPGEEK